MLLKFGDEKVVVDDLKKCPFCGSEVEFKLLHYDEKWGVFGGIMCDECGVYMDCDTFFDKDVERFDGLKEDIARWNRRISE